MFRYASTVLIFALLACVAVGAPPRHKQADALDTLFPKSKVSALVDTVVRRNDAQSLKELITRHDDEALPKETRGMIGMFLRSVDTNWGQALIIPWLRKQREEARPDRRRFYTYELAYKGDEQAKGQLFDLLRGHTRTGSHPSETLFAVKAMRLTAAKPLVIELLKKTKKSHVRLACMEYLFTCADETDLQTVLGFTANPDYQVRFWAYRTLGAIANKEAVEALKKALRKGQGDDAAKVAVPVALADIGTDEALKTLVSYVRATDGMRGTYEWSSLVRTVAMGQGKLVEEFLLEEAKRGSEIATDTLVQRRNEAVAPILIEQLGAGALRRRRRTATGLAKLGHKPAVEPLRKMYENAPNARNAAAPMICLAALGDKAAMEDLRRYIRLTDPWHRTKPGEIEGLERFKKWVGEDQGDYVLSGRQDVEQLMCELGGPVAEYAFQLLEDEKVVQEVEVRIEKQWLEQAEERCQMALEYLAQAELRELDFKKALSLRIVARAKPDDPRTTEVLEKAYEAFPNMPLTAHKRYGKAKREISLALEQMTGKKHPYTIVRERGGF